MPGRRFGAETAERPERPADPAVRKANLRRIFRLFRAYRLKLAVVCGADRLLGRARGDLAVPAARHPRHGDPRQQHAAAERCSCAGMIAISIVTGVIGVFQTLLSTQVGQSVMHDLRTAVYQHLQRLSLAFFTRTRTGDVQSRIANDIGGVDNVRHVDRDLGDVERHDGDRDRHRDVPARLAARAVRARSCCRCSCT